MEGNYIFHVCEFICTFAMLNLHGMKKILAFVLVATVLTVPTYAKPVDQELALKVAKVMLASQGAKEVESLRLVENDIEWLYIFSGRECFAIVSASDVCHPVAGYSTEVSLDINEIAPATQYWIEQYAEQVAFAEENGLAASKEIDEEWARLKEGKGPRDKYSEKVSPLVKSKWGQGYPYNAKCPTVGGSHVVPTGCVATAAAQVMRYWGWPEHGKGQHSYTYEGNPNAVEVWPFGELSCDFENTTFDWNNMPDTLLVSSGEAAIEAVSTLMYACGVAFDMMYNESGSGAFLMEENVLYDTTRHIPIDAAVEFRIVEYLDYASSIAGEMRMDHSDEDWVMLMKEELTAGRPMIYTGFKFDENGIATGGHAFVVDGYNKPGYFHINWGWNGSADAYFGVSAMNPNGYSFNDRQGALMNLKPSTLQSISDKVSETKPMIYTAGRTIVIKGAEGQRMSIYDVMGRMVTSATITDTTEKYSISKSGIYIVRTGEKVQKVHVR